MRGIADTSRRARSTRSARRTENESFDGASVMATMTKSNTLHGSRKNRKPCANRRSAISTQKTATAKPSNMVRPGPSAARAVAEVSSPSAMAFSTISAMIAFWNGRHSTNARTRPRRFRATANGRGRRRARSFAGAPSPHRSAARRKRARNRSPPGRHRPENAIPASPRPAYCAGLMKAPHGASARSTSARSPATRTRPSAIHRTASG